MEAQEVLQLIQSRRSVRHFSDAPVDGDQVDAILEAGRWAPSGLNNQAWRFAVIGDASVRAEIAALTRYGSVITNAPVIIAVFVHRPSMYHEVKDYQAIGACLQNMLLMTQALGLGAVWLGEILKNAEAVRQVLGLSQDLELMAVVALGHPKKEGGKGERKELTDLVLVRR